jgi:hypothetical protein
MHRMISHLKPIGEANFSKSAVSASRSTTIS